MAAIAGIISAYTNATRDKASDLLPLGFPKEGARSRVAIKIFQQSAGVGLRGLNAQSIDQGDGLVG
jgi:hypothetical protein